MIERSAGRIIREIFLLEIVGGGSDGEILGVSAVRRKREKAVMEGRWGILDSGKGERAVTEGGMVKGG
jgi:hypothetical protein